MVAVGSKALPSRRPKTCGLVQDNLMGEDDKLHRRGRRKQANFDSNSNKRVSGKLTVRSVKDNKFSKHEVESAPEKSFVRYEDCWKYDEMHTCWLLLFKTWVSLNYA